ncbi:MAG: LamG-like jellyroll fold domain-containing protein [Cyclobacteriaceae bacterium]
MKTHLKQIFSMLAIASMVLFISCGDDEGEDPIVIEKGALQTALTSANTLLSNAVEGTANGQYLRGSKAVLETAIGLGQQVADSETVTQVQVDNAVITLNQAVTAFEGKEVVPIEPDALMAHWTFNEGQGTTVGDFSGNSNSGSFESGSADNGAGTPSWAADRYGTADRAISFDAGAWIEVPYSTTLNPSEMTISVWLKADVIKANNKILGLNRWEGYKFQLQDTPKAFFTGATDEGIYDRDTDPVLEDISQWYHVVVTFGGGHTIFYVNGIMGTDHDNTPGSLVSVSGYNLAIGSETSNLEEAGDGFFEGQLDEIRIYNKVLTAAQVNSIYELERP